MKISSDILELLHAYPEVGGSSLLQNADTFLPDYTALYPKVFIHNRWRTNLNIALYFGVQSAVMFPPSEDGILRGHCPENFKSHVIIIYIFI
jgi:hypothetical protein